MPFCLNCGNEVPAGARFCGNCGTPAQGTQPGPSSQAPAAESHVFARQVVANPRPEGIRLLVWLSLLVAVVLIGFGVLFIALSPAAPDLGTFFVIIGIATLVPRYGYSNAKRWGWKVGLAAGVAYALLGLFLLLAALWEVSVLGLVLGIASLVFGAATLYYLRKPSTKAYFSK